MQSSSLAMNIARIKETCVYVTNLQVTKEFYSDKLGLPLISLVEGRHVFFKAGKSVLLCFVAEKTKCETKVPPHGASGSVHFAFEVAKKDYEGALEKISGSSIDILHQHVWGESHRSFYFHDPDNNLVEIIEEGMWDADEE
jgi:catechol 2,3-dioxygenase-like lactoylglutathione lyase family enzyme